MGESNRLARSAQADLAVESHLLMRRATWCGIVFALGILLTALNLVPPVDIHYRIISQAVVSNARLVQLQAAQLTATTPSSGVNDDAAANQAAGVISQVKILDRVQGDFSHALNSGQDQQLALVEVESTWSMPCTEQTYATWFEELTRHSTLELDSSAVAKQLRQARWELQAAEHYAAQHAFLKPQLAQSSSRDGRTFLLASTTEQSDMGDGKLNATYANRLPSGTAQAFTGDELPGESADVAQTLTANVDMARQQVSQIELAWQRQIQQSSGELRLSGPIEVVAIPSSIPVWMAMSVLIVGLASGASASWFQFRLHSGGVYDPQAVARQLEQAGIPEIGKLTIAGDNGGGDWIGRTSNSASHASRGAARNLTRISEWFLGIWCLLIVVRLVMDPLWRNVLLESPLAAFGRLLVGLP